MTSARIQPICSKYIINIDCSDEMRINPRNTTQRNIAIKKHNNHFSLIWIPNDKSFNQAIKEIKLNFEVVDHVISDNHVKSFIKYACKPKKFDFHQPI